MRAPRLGTRLHINSVQSLLVYMQKNLICFSGLMKAVLTQYGQMKGKINRNNTNEFHV